MAAQTNNVSTKGREPTHTNNDVSVGRDRNLPVMDKCVSQQCFSSQAISFTASVPETSVSSTNGTVFHTFNPTGAGLSSGP